ncbi:MAG TPA: UDP-N-acetylmuramoyl-L-alanyl-D-glutamate--2,6-diaminopimelate ligase [bacterium]|nr:UDP-N-acetylmuramoyl-L-alanyl-D-glutamate--2,6-diaminopimelate ligase [bacterium]
MRLEEVAALPGVLRAHLHDPRFELGRVHCDSRRADAKTGFVALAGMRTDGHRFVDAARRAGSPALFVSEAAVYERLAALQPNGVAGVFLVAPGRAVLADLSAALQGYPHRSMRLLGVTGTSGKTTVAHLVAQLLAALGQPCARLGTQGLRLGDEVLPSARTTPEAPDIQAFLRHCLERGVRTAVMEVTSIGIALERSRGLGFAAAAFTNLSQDHLDFHHDMESYREAKFRLFLEYDTRASVVNVDDAAGGLLAERLRAAGRGEHLLTYGLEAPAGLTLHGLHTGQGLTEGSLRYQGAEAPFRFGLLGRFNLSNLLAALGLLLATGERLEALAPAIAACSGPAGRFEHVPLAVPFTVVVDYSHKPAALELVLKAARPLARGRLRVLFGCGGERDRTKRPQMGAIAERLADQVVLTSDNPRCEDPETILDEIAAGMSTGTRASRIVERREAIHWLLDQAQPGDVVLIAGKGDEAYQELGEQRVAFDDREVVLEWGRSRGHGNPPAAHGAATK